MADMTNGVGLDFSIEWLSSDGIIAPEIAATWCRFSLSVSGRTVTLIDSDAPLRRSLNVSVYPLAEWIAFNWWRLQYDIRPSSYPLGAWTWPNVIGSPWLASHNFRGAGGGMPWPDLTIVPEGDIARVVWRSGPAMSNDSLRFVGSGDEYVPSGTLTRCLGRFVDSVVERLHEAGVKSALEDEWTAVRGSGDADVEFNAAIARLGLDPYAVDPAVADAVVSASEIMDAALLDEYLDSAIPERLHVAMTWWQDARKRAQGGFAAVSDLRRLFETAGATSAKYSKAHDVGYERARAVRATLGVDVRESLSLTNLVDLAAHTAPSGGLEGLVVVNPGQSCSLVLPTDRLSSASERFAQARALGLALQGGRRDFILDPASTRSARESRAFAAELLAPAGGILSYLAEAQAATDQVFASIASTYGTTSQLVSHQYENQLVTT